MLVLVIISISLTTGIYGQGVPPRPSTNTFDPKASTSSSTPSTVAVVTTSSPTTATIPTLPSTAAPATSTTPTSTLPSTAASTTSTTPSKCKDTIENCAGYGLPMCSDPIYKPWAYAHCIAFCEFCIPTTLTPFKCENKIGICRQFDGGDLCTNTDYFAWSRENCFAYCGYHPCGTTTQPTGTQSP